MTYGVSDLGIPAQDPYLCVPTPLESGPSRIRFISRSAYTRIFIYYLCRYMYGRLTAGRSGSGIFNLRENTHCHCQCQPQKVIYRKWMSRQLCVCCWPGSLQLKASIYPVHAHVPAPMGSLVSPVSVSVSAQYRSHKYSHRLRRYTGHRESCLSVQRLK